MTLILLTGLGISVVYAASPTLAVLSYQEKGKTFDARISTTPGSYASPLVDKPRAVWIVRSGDALKSPPPARERQIQLFHRVGQDDRLLCTLQVKYFPTKDGWRPAYRLAETLTLMPIQGHWQAAPLNNGEMGLIQHLGSAIPNAEGFQSLIKFGLVDSVTHVKYWVVN